MRNVYFREKDFNDIVALENFLIKEGGRVKKAK